MRWSILVATVPSRRVQLMNLTSLLTRQMRDDVEILTLCDNEQIQIGPKRQRLLEMATGEYVSFVDDDDRVAPDYVDRIFPLLDGVDYVGFRLQRYEDGVPDPKRTDHSLRHGGRYETETEYLRDVDPKNPIRRSIAMKVPFEGGYGEDARWAATISARGLARTEHHIEEVMYHYRYISSSRTGAWR